MSENLSHPQFPLYIPTKGRSQYMITSKALTQMGVNHHVVVEEQELEDYQKAIKKWNLLATPVLLDFKFKEQYELCDDLGLTRSTGPGPARNCAWFDAIKKGHKWHWVMDDNIRSFKMLNKNKKIKVSNGKCFRIMEDFCLRYKNVTMAGPNYNMFAPARVDLKPFSLNTRIYSCNFIRNDVPFRWRGRYNEDTILSLDMLKAGYCTVQFYAYLQEKMPTQVLKGGNTGEFYHKEDSLKKGDRYAKKGTFAKSLMQVKVHPDVSKLVYKFGRIHHHVDYTRFKKNKLIKKDNYKIHDYNVKLKKIK